MTNHEKQRLKEIVTALKSFTEEGETVVSFSRGFHDYQLAAMSRMTDDELDARLGLGAKTHGT